MEPLFSIIIPTYNHAHLISRTLESILNQTYHNFEVIIVNNFSTDNTLEVIALYHDPRISVYNFANEGCLAKARNFAMGICRGEFICYCDSDDWWESNKLEVCTRFIENYDLIYHRMRMADINGVHNKILGGGFKGDFVEYVLTNSNCICQSSVVIRKSSLLAISGQDESKTLIGVEDCDCWMRMFLAGYKFFYLKDVLGYLWIGNNMSASLKQIDKEEALHNKYHELLSNTIVKKSLQAVSYRKARIYHRLSMYKEAMKEYKKVLGVNVHLSLKSFVLLLCAFFKLKK